MICFRSGKLTMKLVFTLVPLILGFDLLVTITSQEFIHLEDLANPTGKIHLSAEITRYGQRLQVEEFLDLKVWKQLIQFSWHEDLSTRPGESTLPLVTHKVTFLVLNDGDSRKLIRYEPFKCTTTSVHSWDTGEPQEADWLSSLKSDAYDADLRGTILSIIGSLVSIAPNSPFAVQLETDVSDHSLVLGLSALWLRARDGKHLYSLESRSTDESAPYQIKLPESDSKISYFFESSRGTTMRILESINLQVEGFADTLVNVIDINFEFSPTSVKDLFLKPIGYNCRDSSMTDGLNAEFADMNSVKSHRVDLEIIATHYYEQQNTETSTNFNGFSFASSPHPTDAEARMVMFSHHTEQTKTIFDHKLKLVYTLEQSMNQRLCNIWTEKRLGYSIDNYNIYVNAATGLIIYLGERALTELLFPNVSLLRMRLLNTILTSDRSQQFVFEDELPESLSKIIKSTQSEETSISLVRVYSRQVVTDKETGEIKHKAKLTLNFVKLLIFDKTHSKKIGEIRINIIDVMRPLSLARRATMFDVSSCRDPELESMDITVTYASETDLTDYARRNAFQFINAFYMSSLLWYPSFRKLRQEDEKILSGRDLYRKRLGQSLNFLRVPEVNVEISGADELQLRFTLFERTSPLYAFELISNSSFITDSISHKLYADDKHECAELCLQLTCNIFAYNEDLKQCRLSDQNVDRKLLTDANKIIKSRIVQDKGWNLYVNGEKAPSAVEATLSEFNHYFQQYNDEQDLVYKPDYVGDSKGPMPLLLLELTSKLEVSSIPKRLSLAPSSIRVDRLPTKLANPQSLKLQSAFSLAHKETRYWLEPPDRPKGDQKLWSSSLKYQTHKSIVDSAYYTFKMIDQIDWTTCAQLCYDIDEFEEESASDRVCLAFSHCSMSAECSLLIKTDFNFSKTLSDYLEAEEITSVSSLNRFLHRDLDCSVNKRNFLTGFEGPITLSTGYSHQSDEVSSMGPVYQWKSEKLIDDPLAEDKDEYAISQCARSCSIYRLDSKRCLAFDYCKSSDKVDQLTELKGCRLLLVAPVRMEDRSNYYDLGEIRDKLVRPRKPSSLGRIGSEETCNRFLVSHIREYSAVQKSQLNSQLLASVDRSPDSQIASSLDGCAAECSVQHSECRAFEYCNIVDDSSRVLNQICKLYGASGERFADDSATSSGSWKLDDNCHLYIKHLPKIDHDIAKSSLNQTYESHGLHLIVIVIVLVVLMMGLYFGRFHLIDLSHRLRNRALFK